MKVIQDLMDKCNSIVIIENQFNLQTGGEILLEGYVTSEDSDEDTD